MIDDYINGYIERKAGGEYEGSVRVEGIDLSPIAAQLFKRDGETYLWLFRQPRLVYDQTTQTYKKRARQPKWECYLKKQVDDNKVAYRGEFLFMHFKFNIVGVWDRVMGMDKCRLNLFVERLPMSEQTIINNIKERNKHND